MNRNVRIAVSLAVAAAICWTALAVLVPIGQASPAASKPDDCRSAGWTHVWAGWGGGDCG